VPRTIRHFIKCGHVAMQLRKWVKNTADKCWAEKLESAVRSARQDLELGRLRLGLVLRIATAVSSLVTFQPFAFTQCHTHIPIFYYM